MVQLVRMKQAMYKGGRALSTFQVLLSRRRKRRKTRCRTSTFRKMMRWLVKITEIMQLKTVWMKIEGKSTQFPQKCLLKTPKPQKDTPTKMARRQSRLILAGVPWAVPVTAAVVVVPILILLFLINLFKLQITALVEIPCRCKVMEVILMWEQVWPQVWLKDQAQHSPPQHPTPSTSPICYPKCLTPAAPVSPPRPKIYPLLSQIMVEVKQCRPQQTSSKISLLYPSNSSASDHNNTSNLNLMASSISSTLLPPSEQIFRAV